MEMKRKQSSKCSGACLQQYDVNCYFRFMECEENCELLKCPNFSVCGGAAPEQVMDSHRGTCLNCDIVFGKNLTFIDSDEECPAWKKR
jgi:hypothetical protein